MTAGTLDLNVRGRNCEVGPVVAQKKPGLMDRVAIHAFVQTIWTENIIEIVAMTIAAGGLEVVTRANFTSTAD